ncbi:MAG: cyclopropane-fatty-acyl-phospholipid synthase, partial [Calditrichaeota bacterium]
MKAESIITELLEGADVTINGKRPWDIHVHDRRFYRRLLSEASLGLGESYMDGWWDCEALDEAINRVLRAELDVEVTGNWKMALYALKTQIFNRQNKSRSLQVGEQHYDLGNDLYQAMLDSRLNYTCGYWKSANDLDKAQEDKLE